MKSGRIRRFVWHQIKGAVKDVGYALWDFVIATGEFIQQLIEFGAAMLIPTVVAGLVIVCLYFLLFGWHEAVYHTAPIAYKAGHGVQDAVNGAEEAIEKVASAGTSIANFGSSIVNTFTGGHSHVNSVHLKRVHFDIDELKDPTVSCHKFTEGDYIATLAFKYMASGHVCYVLRFFWGTWIHDLIEPFVGWLSWDSEPYPGNNCKSPGEKIYFCLAANVHLALIEILIIVGIISLVAIYFKSLFWLSVAFIRLSLLPLAIFVWLIRAYAHSSLSYT